MYGAKPLGHLDLQGIVPVHTFEFRLRRIGQHIVEPDRAHGEAKHDECDARDSQEPETIGGKLGERQGERKKDRHTHERLVVRFTQEKAIALHA